MTAAIVTLPSLNKSFTLNTSMRNEKYFNMPILNKSPTRNAWRRCLPSYYMPHFCKLAAYDEDEEKPITAAGAIYLYFYDIMVEKNV